MNEEKKLNELLKEVSKIAPTILLIGSTGERGVFYCTSPEKTAEEKTYDLAGAIAMMIDTKPEAHDLLLGAVSYYLQVNPDEQTKMYNALNMMKQAKAKS